MSFKNVAIILLLLTITLSAQNEIKKTGGVARLKSMGDNSFIIDPTNMLTNPAYGAYYDNFVWGDIGSTSNLGSDDGVGQFIGTSIRLNKSFTIGVMLSKSDHAYSRYNIMSIVTEDINQYMPNDVPSPQNNTELFGTYKMDNTVLGFGLSYSGSGVEQDYKGIDYKKEERAAHQFGLNLGLLTKLSESIDLEASAMFLAAGNMNDLDSLRLEGSQTILSIDARAFIKITDRVNFIPTLGFYTISGDIEYTKKPAVGEYNNFDAPSITNFRLGIGFDYSYSNLLFVGGPSIEFGGYNFEIIEEGTKTTSDLSETSIIWVLGLEWSATSWLTGRIGYKDETNYISYESKHGNYSSKLDGIGFMSTNGFTLGIGLKFDKFSLDATVNEDMIRQGLRMIGGDFNTFGYVSLSYAF